MDSRTWSRISDPVLPDIECRALSKFSKFDFLQIFVAVL